MQEKSYFEQLDDIATAFEKGETYECLVVNSSMEPLFKAHQTWIKLVPVNNKNKLYYGSIVLYSRMSQSISIRWIKGLNRYTVNLRGVMQSHSENKVPRSNIIGIVSEFKHDDQWIKMNSLRGFTLKCWYTLRSLGYRLLKPLKDLIRSI